MNPSVFRNMKAKHARRFAWAAAREMVPGLSIAEAVYQTVRDCRAAQINGNDPGEPVKTADYGGVVVRNFNLGAAEKCETAGMKTALDVLRSNGGYAPAEFDRERLKRLADNFHLVDAAAANPADWRFIEEGWNSIDGIKRRGPGEIPRQDLRKQALDAYQNAKYFGPSYDQISHGGVNYTRIIAPDDRNRLYVAIRFEQQAIQAHSTTDCAAPLAS